MRTQNLPTLLKNNDGVTAIEFALISPAFLLMVMGMIEFGVIMLAQNVMEGATFSASRLGKTGFVAENISREQTIYNEIEKRAGTMLDMTQLVITSKAYSGFGEVGDPEPFIDANANGVRDSGENYTDVNGNGVYDTDVGTVGLGEAGEVVVYTANYPWHIATPLLKNLVGVEGIINLSARTVVQNEPYNED